MGKSTKNLNSEILDQLKEVESLAKINFNLKSLETITPLTENQAKVFDLYDKGYHLLMHGTAGTGKTFLTVYKALQDVLNEDTPYNKLVIIRSAVQTRDMGFMPGDENEKISYYELPYIPICDEIMVNHTKNYENLKKKGLIEFHSTSFIRGITIRNAIVLVDEVENLNYHEIKSVFTRIGKNSKIMFCGDIEQSDLSKGGSQASGLGKFMNVIKLMNTKK